MCLCLWLLGFKLRKRKVLNEPTGGIGGCPHLTEAIPCEEPSCYDWLLLKLDECIPDNDRECGPGTQDPQVQCVNSDGKAVGHIWRTKYLIEYNLLGVWKTKERKSFMVCFCWQKHCDEPKSFSWKCSWTLSTGSLFWSAAYCRNCCLQTDW